jgi:anaerobic selenocysteine-containing dehydrogenase
MATLGNRGKGRWQKYLEHYDHIRDDIEKVIPGFTDYNQRVRKLGGFYLPNASREGRFNTFSGRAEFNIAQAVSIPLNDGEYLMMTIRSHDQFNTTIYGLNDRYRGIHNERRVIFMNANDMQQAGLEAHDHADLVNEKSGTTRIARKFIVIPYNIPERCTATYYPETNVLVPIDDVAEKSNTPVSKSVVIRIRKSGH